MLDIPSILVKRQILWRYRRWLKWFYWFFSSSFPSSVATTKGSCFIFWYLFVASLSVVLDSYHVLEMLLSFLIMAAAFKGHLQFPGCFSLCAQALGTANPSLMHFDACSIQLLHRVWVIWTAPFHLRLSSALRVESCRSEGKPDLSHCQHASVLHNWTVFCPFFSEFYAISGVLATVLPVPCVFP